MNETVPAPSPTILTRIYIGSDGNIVVTDMWEEIAEILKEGGFE